MTNDNMNKNVDEAIAKAKAKIKEQALNAEGAENNFVEKKTLSDDERHALTVEREEKKMQRALLREQKKAERELQRLNKKEERAAMKKAKALEKMKNAEARKPAHMSKVEKAAAKLPELDMKLGNMFEELIQSFTVSELSLLIAHLQVSNRFTQTLASSDVKFDVGQQVRILSSENDASLIGQTGTVTEMRKIRVLLDVEQINRPVYLFAADCEPLFIESFSSDTNDTEETVEGINVSEDGFLFVEENSTGTDN